MQKKIFFIQFFLISFFYSSFAQKDSIFLDVYSGFIAGRGEFTPFWISANQHGRYSVTNNQAFAGIKLAKNINAQKRVDYGFGLEPYLRYDTSGHAFVHQLYAEGKFGFLKLSAGWKEEVFGIHDSMLSTGSILWAGNAPPMPKVSLQTNGFVDIPYTAGWVKFKGLLAHGWFEEDRWVKSPLLHHKNLYLQIGPPLARFIFGIEHFAMWGGTSSDPRYGEFSQTWYDFVDVFFGSSGDSTRTSIDGEVINALGNHVASYNFGLNIDLDDLQMMAYYQHIIEDGSGYRMKNWEDGLWGLSVRLKRHSILSGINVEFVNTTDQGVEGIFYWLLHNDNYFNNYVYHDGWTYKDYILGTPLIASQAYNKESHYWLRNNRIMALNMGFSGNFNKLQYLTNFLVSRNKGILNDWLYDKYSFTNPYFEGAKQQFSTNLKLTYPLNQWIFSTQIGLDIGEEFGNNFSALVKINYRLNLK